MPPSAISCFNRLKSYALDDRGDGLVGLRGEIVAACLRRTAAPFGEVGVAVPGADRHGTGVDRLDEALRQLALLGPAALADNHLGRDVPPVDDDALS